MRRAFSVCFPADEALAVNQANLAVGQENAATNYMHIEDSEMREDIIPDSFYDSVDNKGKKTRLQCFSHRIKDGMKDSKAVSPALYKCSKLYCTFTRCSFK